MNAKSTAVATKGDTKNSNTATDTKGADTKGANAGDGGAGGEAEASKPDPFANIPIAKLHEAEVQDLSGFPTGPARKYQKVHEAAVTTKMPVQAGWKHERAVFVAGTNRKELKPTSVHGTIQAIVAAAGRAGINAYDLVAQVRVKQVGNKRSVYCSNESGGALPAVGWAEGWINSAVTRGIISVHATKQAPALRADQKAAAGTESTKAQDDAAKKVANA